MLGSFIRGVERQRDIPGVFTTGSPLHAPPMPRMAETEALRSHPIVRRRACQDSFREHRGDSAPTEDIVCGIRSTYEGGASAKEGDVWGACWG